MLDALSGSTQEIEDAPTADHHGRCLGGLLVFSQSFRPKESEHQPSENRRAGELHKDSTDGDVRSQLVAKDGREFPNNEDDQEHSNRAPTAHVAVQNEE